MDHSSESGGSPAKAPRPTRAATRLDPMLQALADGCALLDDAGRIVDVNAALCRLTGHDAAELIGRGAASLRAERQDARGVIELRRTLARQGHARGEVWARRKDGAAFGAWLSLSRLPASAGGGCVALLADINAARLRREHQAYQARIDATTGLPSGGALRELAQRALLRAARRAQQQVMYVVDLDRFRAVRDDYGVDVGERLLYALAARLRQQLPPGALLARTGGDTFAVLLGGSASDAPRWAEALRLACAGPWQLGELGVELALSASVGFALFPDDGADADTLLAAAEDALGDVKAGGGNAWRRFDAQRASDVQRLRERLDEVRAAIDAREFVVHYQPQVHMPSGRLCGVEALVRWDHPQRGLVRPDAFVELIESNSLIAAFTAWLLDEVLGQIGLWREQGWDIPVSLNIAPYHLRRADFVALLQSALHRHPQVQPAMLVLDVTEGSVEGDAAAAARNVAACRALGVSVALDDFGHGEASLAALRALQADVVKIDQRVVRGMLGDAGDAEVVRGIVGLGRALHKGVVAEGVETSELARALLAAGCEYAQGYAIAQPMPAPQLLDWLARWRPDASWSTVH